MHWCLAVHATIDCCCVLLLIICLHCIDCCLQAILIPAVRVIHNRLDDLAPLELTTLLHFELPGASSWCCFLRNRRCSTMASHHLLSCQMQFCIVGPLLIAAVQQWQKAGRSHADCCCCCPRLIAVVVSLAMVVSGWRNNRIICRWWCMEREMERGWLELLPWRHYCQLAQHARIDYHLSEQMINHFCCNQLLQEWFQPEVRVYRQTAVRDIWVVNRSKNDVSSRESFKKRGKVK